MKGYYQQDGIWYPEYPDLGVKVAKLRHGADRKAHGEAVLEAMRAKHRTLHMRPTPSLAPNWYSPPSITRLLRYERPIKMQGDPDWIPKCSCRRYGKCDCDHWGAREQAVYTQAMKEKACARP